MSRNFLQSSSNLRKRYINDKVARVRKDFQNCDGIPSTKQSRNNTATFCVIFPIVPCGACYMGVKNVAIVILMSSVCFTSKVLSYILIKLLAT